MLLSAATLHDPHIHILYSSLRGTAAGTFARRPLHRTGAVNLCTTTGCLSGTIHPSTSCTGPLHGHLGVRAPDLYSTVAGHLRAARQNPRTTTHPHPVQYHLRIHRTVAVNLCAAWLTSSTIPPFPILPRTCLTTLWVHFSHGDLQLTLHQLLLLLLRALPCHFSAAAPL